MIKLTLGIVGITLSAIGTFLLFQSQNSQRSGYSSATVTSTLQGKPDLSSTITLVNDIKEIFGLPPIGSQGSLLSGKFGGGGGGGSGGGSGGPEAVGYLPPKSLRTDLFSSGASDDQATTPFFRIIITTKSQPSSTSSTFPSGRKEETLFESTTTKGQGSTEKTYDDNVDSQSIAETTAQMEMKSSTEAIKRPPTTLEPPSTSIVSTNQTNPMENEVSLESSMKGRSDNSTQGGLYLPPNKEYLPPRT